MPLWVEHRKSTLYDAQLFRRNVTNVKAVPWKVNRPEHSDKWDTDMGRWEWVTRSVRTVHTLHPHIRNAPTSFNAGVCILWMKYRSSTPNVDSAKITAKIHIGAVFAAQSRHYCMFVPHVHLFVHIRTKVCPMFCSERIISQTGQIQPAISGRTKMSPHLFVCRQVQYNVDLCTTHSYVHTLYILSLFIVYISTAQHRIATMCLQYRRSAHNFPFSHVVYVPESGLMIARHVRHR